MATKKISALTELTTPAGTEELIVNAGGTSKKIQIDNLPSSLDDNSVTLAKMASGTDGNLITYDASGDPAYVTTGTSGQILTSGGAGVAPTFQTAGGGATELNDLSDASTSATGNYGIGTGAIDSITTGDRNVGFGGSAGTAITTGADNVAIGNNSLVSNVSSLRHVAIGTNALSSHTTNNANVAIGYNCLANNVSGDENVGIGDYALNANTAAQNTAVGEMALKVNTSGYSNTAVGTYSLKATTTGNNCAAVGRNSNSTSATASGEFTLGDSSISNLRCNDTSISSLSDERDKTNIIDLPDTAGLELINKLRPVTFNWDRREWYEDGVTDGSKVMPTYRSWKPNSGLRQGFIAQEVESAISGEKCLEDSMIVTGTEDKKEFAPQHLLTNAIKAIQQLSAEMEILKSEIATLKGV